MQVKLLLYCDLAELLVALAHLVERGHKYMDQGHVDAGQQREQQEAGDEEGRFAGVAGRSPQRSGHCGKDEHEDRRPGAAKIGSDQNGREKRNEGQPLGHHKIEQIARAQRDREDQQRESVIPDGGAKVAF